MSYRTRFPLLLAAALSAGCAELAGLTDVPTPVDAALDLDTNVGSMPGDDTTSPQTSDQSTAKGAEDRTDDAQLSGDGAADPGPVGPPEGSVPEGSTSEGSTSEGGVCTPDLKRCTDAGVQTCNANGSWATGASCPAESPFCVGSGMCGECDGQTSRCAQGGVQTCGADGHYMVPVACSTGTCVDGTCAGVCASGNKQCSGTTSIQTCGSDGKWGIPAACTNQACLAGPPAVCGGVCGPGSAQCSTSSPNSVETCGPAGQWVSPPVACTKRACVNGRCVGMCSPTATQCMGTVPQTCNAAGTWVNGSVTAGQCGALCTPTMTQCMGAIPQICDAIGGWQNHAVTAGQCGAVCNPTATTCSGNSVKPCGADGQWGTPVACSGNTPVCLPATGECVACAPQTTKCSDGQNLLTCGTDGAWMSPAACPVAMPYCYQGSCASVMKPSSCQRGGAGLSDCGPSGEDCCTSFSVPGGTYYRSYDGVTLGFTTQDSPATVSSFRLDKYEVTMGRFRQFVNAIVGGFFVGTGSGKHIHLNSGQGLADSGSPGSFESGWDFTWNSSMASTMAGWTANLQCPLGGSMGDWTATPGANESRPIDCETWFEAYAFCIWDGGFLPSEAEWNYAAAGGAEQRVYPWSVPPTSTNIDCTYANFDEGSAGCPSLFVNNNVGSNSPKGDGKWGHTDLAGNAAEWGLDWTASPYDKPCTDCAHLTPSQSAPGTYKTVRGGGSSFSAHALITAIRNQNNVPTTRHPDIGFRCARTP